MIWRLIIGLALGFLAYRVYLKVKGALTQGKPTFRAPEIREPDTLVQDPVCGTFIPRQDALKTTRGGKDYFFCSEGCLKGFLRSGDKYLK